VNKECWQFSNFLQQLAQDLIWKTGTFFCDRYFDLKAQGIEHLPQQGGYLIVANHVSHLDGIVIIAAHGRHLQNIYSLAAKDYFFDRSWKSWLYQYLFNMLPFQRQGKFLDCLKTCKSIVSEGKYVLFFPEGTRSIDGEMQPLKLGLGILAMYLQVPIIPVYVSGTYQALPKGKLFPHKSIVKVTFGAPLEFYQEQHHLSKEERNKRYRKIITVVNDAITSLKNSQD
jgi:1-acyl-sn-glycerol-3-phosphate acyltransferase